MMFCKTARKTVFCCVVLAAVCLLSACEEEYTECQDSRAPSDFPAKDRSAQCDYVCGHMVSIGCRLGCPFLPEAGADADQISVETSDLDCWTSCMAASTEHPEIPEAGITRALRCYAGTETCRQIGACSRLCSLEGAMVWPDEFLCITSAE